MGNSNSRNKGKGKGKNKPNGKNQPPDANGHQDKKTNGYSEQPRRVTLPPTPVPTPLPVVLTSSTFAQKTLPAQQRPPAIMQMRALFPFERQVDGDMSFKKDDILELIDNSDEFWWKMRNSETGEVGFVPYNYVQPFDGGPTSMAAWFYIDRREAERNLLMPGQQEGTFLLRPCRQKAYQAAYSLSVRTEEDAPGVGKQVFVKHYMVKTTDSNGFYIAPKSVFASMQELVKHYTADRDGLCCRLTLPCPRTYVPPPQFRDFELNRNQLTMMEKLGNGSFGEVWKAKLGRLVEVAVKQMITNGGLSMNKDEFIQEAETMHKLHHPKIVQLLGVCTKEEPFYIVTELMPNGALLSYLRNDNKNGRRITFDNMLDMLFQVADGMAYLEEKKFIHRDLRAANILVGYENIVKVGDFGLSRLMEEDVYGVTENTKFPIRWTAPEAATEKIFTTKSDVWSFGVLIYEIVTRGGQPYPKFPTNREILKVVSAGHRMDNPHNPELGIQCDESLYQNVMMACWKQDPADRPTFATLKGIFESYNVEMQRQYE